MAAADDAARKHAAERLAMEVEQAALEAERAEAQSERAEMQARLGALQESIKKLKDERTQLKLDVQFAEQGYQSRKWGGLIGSLLTAMFMGLFWGVHVSVLTARM